MSGETELPLGWTAHKDPDTAFTYYFHAATGESRWEKPAPTSVAKPAAPPGAPTQAQQRAAAAVSVAASTALPAGATTHSSGGAAGAPAKQGQGLHSKLKSEGVRAMLGLNVAPRAGPMWENEAFIDLFLDGYNLYKRHSISKGFAKDAASVFAPALQAAHDEWEDSLKQLGQQKKEAIESLTHVVQDFHDLCRCLPSRSKSEQQCLEFVHGIITRIKALPVGGHIMAPGGWADTTEDFALIFIIERVTTDRLTLAVCNSGPDGLSYHPIKADLLNAANMKYKMSLVFEDVPDARLCDSTFWFLVSRMHVWPAETHNAKMLYEMLLPGLNQRTLAATQALNIEADLPSTGWSVPPQGGDPSFIYGMMEACELILARRGFTQQERDTWALIIRWQVCRELNLVRRVFCPLSFSLSSLSFFFLSPARAHFGSPALPPPFPPSRLLTLSVSAPV